MLGGYFERFLDETPRIISYGTWMCLSRKLVQTGTPECLNISAPNRGFIPQCNYAVLLCVDLPLTCSF